MEFAEKFVNTVWEDPTAGRVVSGIFMAWIMLGWIKKGWNRARNNVATPQQQQLYEFLSTLVTSPNGWTKVGANGITMDWVPPTPKSHPQQQVPVTKVRIDWEAKGFIKTLLTGNCGEISMNNQNAEELLISKHANELIGKAKAIGKEVDRLCSATKINQMLTGQI